MAKKFKDLAGACWKGYKAVGLKDKNGKKVPNCVPEETQMEAEQIDELDKSTIASYAKKASKDARIKSMVAKDMEHRGDRAKKNSTKMAFDSLASDWKKKAWKREDGVNKAVDRLAKEEVEHINELTDDQIKKLHADAADIQKKSLDKQSDDRIERKKKPESFMSKVGRKIIGGVSGAYKGFTKEEVEEIEELNKSTLGSYVKKASIDMANKSAEVQKDLDLAKSDYSMMRRKGFKKPMAQKIMQRDVDTALSKVSKVSKRMGGISKATDRLAKEEVDREERSDYSVSLKTGRKVHKQIVFKDGEEKLNQEEIKLDEGTKYVVHYTNKNGEHVNSSKAFDDKAKADAHAAKGNAMDKVGGKYTVKTINNEELKGNQHKIDKNKNGKLDKQDFKLLRKEDFENGEIEQMTKSYKQFVEELNEIKMADLPSRKVTGRGYGTEYYKKEAEQDKKGYDDEKPAAKPAGEKRGRGRPVGSTSGARQKGSIAKRKSSGVEMTGYPLHLPNKN